MAYIWQQVALLAVSLSVLAGFGYLVGTELAALADALQLAVESASR